MHRVQEIAKENNFAVATIIGYALTLGICAMILTSTTFIVSTYVNRRSESAAKIEAQALANRIVNLVSEVANLKQMLPTEEINYEKKIKLPYKLTNYNYYIEIIDSDIWVKTTNGQINEKCTTYNVLKDTNLVNSISTPSSSSKIYCGSGYLKISIDDTSVRPVDILLEDST